mgnify:CR=1 FL=1
MSKLDKTRHNKKKLLEALEKSLGIVTTACKIAGLHRCTYYEYYNTDEEFKKACDDMSNIVLDFAESQLHKQIKDGNPSSTIKANYGYAARLDEGWSSQAPQGMSGDTIKDMESQVNKIVRKLNR